MNPEDWPLLGQVSMPGGQVTIRYSAPVKVGGSKYLHKLAVSQAGKADLLLDASSHSPDLDKALTISYISRFLPELKDVDPEVVVSGTIYDILCPWCNNVIDTLFELSVQPGDVVDCNHCVKPIEILSIADTGSIMARKCESC